jgi:membrane peptidoglycan carboxypeptidase
MEVTYKRKIKEIFVAQELERKYNKEQIMEFYLNAIYFSNGHYGIQSAAQAYFGEGVNSLSISQIAFLCSIPNNPNLYNPLTHMENTLKRRDRVLKQMFENDKITQAEYDKALAETIELKKDKSDNKDYVQSYVYSSAIKALMKKKGFEFQNQFNSDADKKAYQSDYEELYDSIQKDLYIHGYRIYTSIDMDKQKILQKSVDDTLKGFTEKDKDGSYKMQGAAVCIDNDTGRVVAIVGGRKQNLGSYTLNRAYQSYRQPGSSIKPLIVYTPILERGYTPNTIVNDHHFKDGPKNSNNRYLGKIPLKTAVEKSINTVAWQVLQEVTPKVGLSYLLRMNFNKIVDTDYTLAAALGGLTNGVSPIEMASAYATLENNGVYREPTCIVKIIDSDGKIVVDDNMATKEVYDSKAAKLMTEIMTGVIRNGTGRGLGLSHTVSAGKTGTTNDKKDGWFCGYTPYYTTTVWVGYDTPKTVYDLMGNTYPGRIWHNYMEEIHTSSMTRKFETYKWNKKEKKEDAQATVTPSVAPTPTTVAATPTPEPEVTDDGSDDTTDDGTYDDSTDDSGDTTNDTTGSDSTDGSDTTGDNGTINSDDLNQ